MTITDSKYTLDDLNKLSGDQRSGFKNLLDRFKNATSYTDQLIKNLGSKEAEIRTFQEKSLRVRSFGTLTYCLGGAGLAFSWSRDLSLTIPTIVTSAGILMRVYFHVHKTLQNRKFLEEIRNTKNDPSGKDLSVLLKDIHASKKALERISQDNTAVHAILSVTDEMSVTRWNKLKGGFEPITLTLLGLGILASGCGVGVVGTKVIENALGSNSDHQDPDITVAAASIKNDIDAAAEAIVATIRKDIAKATENTVAIIRHVLINCTIIIVVAVDISVIGKEWITDNPVLTEVKTKVAYFRSLYSEFRGILDVLVPISQRIDEHQPAPLE